MPLPMGRQICTLPREERLASHFQLIRTHALEGAKHAVDRIDYEQARCQVIQRLAAASGGVEALVGGSREREHHRMVIQSRIRCAAAAIAIVVEGKVLPMPTSNLPEIPRQTQERSQLALGLALHCVHYFGRGRSLAQYIAARFVAILVLDLRDRDRGNFVVCIVPCIERS